MPRRDCRCATTSPALISCLNSLVLSLVLSSFSLQNGVCSNMMVMQNRKLRYWGGNYDMYVKTRAGELSGLDVRSR